MRESGYSEELIFDFDGMIAELMMFVESKMKEQVERTAPERPKANTIQVPRYGNLSDLFEEIEANNQAREMLGQETIATMGNQEEMTIVAEKILDKLPVRF